MQEEDSHEGSPGSSEGNSYPARGVVLPLQCAVDRLLGRPEMVDKTQELRAYDRRVKAYNDHLVITKGDYSNSPDVPLSVDYDWADSDALHIFELATAAIAGKRLKTARKTKMSFDPHWLDRDEPVVYWVEFGTLVDWARLEGIVPDDGSLQPTDGQLAEGSIAAPGDQPHAFALTNDGDGWRPITESEYKKMRDQSSWKLLIDAVGKKIDIVRSLTVSDTDEPQHLTEGNWDTLLPFLHNIGAPPRKGRFAEEKVRRAFEKMRRKIDRKKRASRGRGRRAEWTLFQSIDESLWAFRPPANLKFCVLARPDRIGTRGTE